MATKSARTWQEELKGKCKKQCLGAPVYNIVSDRRGGRTAWSAVVTVDSTNYAAHCWYDGQLLYNAKEDAAEIGITRLKNPALATNTSAKYNGEAGEEEKIEPKDKPMPEDALFRVGKEILD